MNSKPSQETGLLDFITNIIIRPPRELYTIDKLGPRHMAVKSNVKALKIIQNAQNNSNNSLLASDNSQCQIIQVQRKQITIISNNNLIQISIFQPKMNTQKQDQHKSQIDHQIQSISLISDFTKLKKQNNKNGLQNYCNKKNYKKCVVFLHANSGSRLQYLDYIKFILQYNSICIAFDYAGSGLSQGTFTSMGVKQSEDLSNVLLQIDNLYNIQTFSLWGRSMGAVTCVYFLLEKIKQKNFNKKICIQSCVIDSPFCNLQKLAIQIASSKTKLPQFVFQPLIGSIQERIRAKIGINIFQRLNLIKLIQNLSDQQKSSFKKVRFLFLASKDDKLINFTHSQLLFQKLYGDKNHANQYQVRQSEKYSFKIDKQFKHFYQWKKSLNMNGDLIEIGGDHNKPRSNEIKQKCSLFIHANFEDKNNHNQLNKSIEVELKKNTGKSIKEKLSFSKRSNDEKNLLNRSQTNTSKKVENQFILNKKKIQMSIDHLHSMQKQKLQEESLINLSYLKNQNLKKRQSLSKNKIESFKKIKSIQTPITKTIEPTIQPHSFQQKSNPISLHTSLSKKSHEQHQKKGLNVVSKQCGQFFINQDKHMNNIKPDLNQNQLKNPQKTQPQKIFSSTATCLSPHIIDSQQFFKKPENNKQSLQNSQIKISKLSFKQKKISLGNQRKVGLNNTDRASIEQYREGLRSQRMCANNQVEKQTKNETNLQYQNFLKLKNQFNQIKSNITLKKRQQIKQTKDYSNNMKGFPSMTEDSFHIHQQRTQRYYTNTHNQSIKQMKTSNLSNFSQKSQSNLSNNNSTNSYQLQFSNQQSSFQNESNNQNVDNRYQNNYVNLNNSKPYIKPQTPDLRNYNAPYQFYYPQQKLNKDKSMSQSSTFNYQTYQYRPQEVNSTLFKKSNQNTSQQYIREVKSYKYPTKTERQERDRRLNQNFTAFSNQNQGYIHYENPVQKFVNNDQSNYVLKIKSMRNSQQVSNTHNFKSQNYENSYQKTNFQFNNLGNNIERVQNKNDNLSELKVDQQKQILQYKTKITKLV